MARRVWPVACVARRRPIDGRLEAMFELTAAEALVRGARGDALDPTLRVPDPDETRVFAELAKYAKRRVDEDERWVTIAARAWLGCAHTADRAPKVIADLASRFPSYALRKAAADALAIRACRSPRVHLAARAAYDASCVEDPNDLSARLMLLRSSRLARHASQPALLEDALDRQPALEHLPDDARPVFAAERVLALFSLRRTNAASLLAARRQLDASSPRRIELARAYALDAVTSAVAEHDTVAALLAEHPEIRDEVAEGAKAHQRWRFLYETFAELPLRGVAGAAVTEAYVALHHEPELIERTEDATEDAGAAVLHGRACALTNLAAMTNAPDPERLRRRALEALEAALRADPRHVPSHVLSASLLHRSGDAARAAECAERSLSLLATRHPGLVHVLASAKRELGDHATAEALLREVARCGWPLAKRARAELREWYGVV